jgi:hypothetical protein
MKIKELYKKGEPITIESYLEKHGVQDVDNYLHLNKKPLFEPTSHYKNMEEGWNMLKSFMYGGNNYNEGQ